MASVPEAAGDPARSDGPTAAAAGGRRIHHFRRLFLIWFVLSAVGDPLFYFLAGPHIPPGDMTTTANGQQFDFNILFIVALPVVIAVWTYLGYAVFTWRASRNLVEPPPPPANSRQNVRLQFGWIALTTCIVMGLFIFGTYELIVPAGAGGGEGSNPIWTPASHNVLTVQVIGQQWMWTYRYPSFGGFETPDLVIPADTTIAFHVTSLDVIHDFWAYELGVKADANPDYDNVAYTTTTNQTGVFVVRCDELCGLWHGSMYDYGRVETKANFMKWATSTEKRLAKETKLLPPFAYTYTPDANGADGGFYPDNVDPYSNVEQYGAKQQPATT